MKNQKGHFTKQNNWTSALHNWLDSWRWNWPIHYDGEVSWWWSNSVVSRLFPNFLTIIENTWKLSKIIVHTCVSYHRPTLEKKTDNAFWHRYNIHNKQFTSPSHIFYNVNPSSYLSNEEAAQAKVRQVWYGRGSIEGTEGDPVLWFEALSLPLPAPRSRNSQPRVLGGRTEAAEQHQITEVCEAGRTDVKAQGP